jgi:ESS family glutamate:Na+ symporter
MYGMVVAFGQWTVGLVTTGIFLTPVFGVPPLFGAALPVGFAGGHGTAAAFADIFASNGWPEGGDVSLMFATVGLILSILLGVFWVNVAARKGWVVKEKMDNAKDAKLSLRGVYPADKRPAAGIQTVSSDSIDSLAFHLAILGIAITIGYLAKQLLILIESSSSALEEFGFLSGFPLFPLCMMGGILLQLGLEKFNRQTRLVDASTMERISGTSLDFLIVAAIASVDMGSVADNLAPIALLCVIGIGWHFACLYFLGPILLPNHWFERAIADMGMNMGVIASGLVLLRMVDPESKTPVPADFAYKQLLHSPFMGGGLWTCIAVPMLAAMGSLPMALITGGFMAMWLALYRFYFKPQYDPMCKCGLCTSRSEGLDGDTEDRKDTFNEALLPNTTNSVLDSELAI